MLRRLCSGFGGETFRDTLYFYLVGLATIAPVIALVGFFFGLYRVFYLTPMLAASFVFIVSRIWFSRKSGDGQNWGVWVLGIFYKLEKGNNAAKKRHVDAGSDGVRQTGDASRPEQVFLDRLKP